MQLAKHMEAVFLASVLCCTMLAQWPTGAEPAAVTDPGIASATPEVQSTVQTAVQTVVIHGKRI